MGKIILPRSVRTVIQAPEFAEFLAYLHGRWQDEKEYEDINEYGKAFTKKTKFEVTKCYKRPFGFDFKTADLPDALFRLKVTARHIAIERVK